MKNCPYCEWEISDTARKCKHCWEWVKEKKEIIEDDDNYSEPEEKWSRKINSKKWKINKDKKTETVHENETKKWNRIKEFISDYWIILCIAWFLLLKPLYNQYFNQNKETIAERDYNIEKELAYSNLEEELTKKYELVWWGDITWSNEWYILFPGTEWEYRIEWESNIIAFTDAIKDAKKWEIIKWQQSKINKSQSNNYWVNSTILIDNSYSEGLNWEIDKSWPEQRLGYLKNYLNRDNFPDWSKIDLSFLYTVIPDDNSEEPDSNMYHIKINSSDFDILFKKTWKWDPFYDNKRLTLIRRDVELIPTFSGDEKCKNDVWWYTCYDAESAFDLIYKLFKDKYDNDEKHTNNMFLKSIAKDKDIIFWTDKDNVWIFTNWEFKVWYEWEEKYLSSLKKKYKTLWKHDEGADKTHNLTEFTMRYANWYQRDQKYETFWDEAIWVLKPQLPLCDNIEINIVWLSRSAEFKPLAEKVYNKIFKPCEVNYY